MTPYFCLTVTISRLPKLTRERRIISRTELTHSGKSPRFYSHNKGETYDDLCQKIPLCSSQGGIFRASFHETLFCVWVFLVAGLRELKYKRVIAGLERDVAYPVIACIVRRNRVA